MTWDSCPLAHSHQHSWQRSSCFFHRSRTTAHRACVRGFAAAERVCFPNEKNESRGSWLGKGWEHIPQPTGRTEPFLCFKAFHGSCQEAAFTAASNGLSLLRKENNCGFFLLPVTASILANSYLFSATSHLPKHNQKCSNYCQLSLGS